MGKEPGLARVELAMHLISSRYASIACCVTGLEGGPSVGTPKAIILFPVSLVCALAGLRCSFNWRRKRITELHGGGVGWGRGSQVPNITPRASSMATLASMHEP